MVLDAIFVPFLGLVGAATATAISQMLGGVIPLFYFFRKNDSLLRLGKCRFEGRVLGGICVNGSSELMSNVSASVVALLFNSQLMKFLGYKGVSAYGIVMYIGFIFIAIFLGYAIGSAPIVGYNYGAENEKELKNIFKKSMVFVFAVGAFMTALSFALASPLAFLFSGGDAELHALATHAMRVYSFSFLICGVNIFASAFFTALSNGGVSALLAFLRMFAFQALAVLVLPIFFKVEGVWWSVGVAEFCAAITSFLCFFLLRKRYRYL
jgi:Na+-driven multidrug efflux pump